MELMIEKLLGFVLVLTRISACFLVLPVFGSRNIPANIKVAMTMLLAVFFSMVVRLPISGSGVSSLQAGLLIAGEAFYGLALGLIVNVVFSAVRFGVHIVEQEMGLTMAEVLDPLTGDSADPLSLLIEMLFIVLFLSVNGHHMLLMILSRSYDSFPVGSTPTIPVMTEGVIKSGTVMFVAALRMAAPMLAIFLLLKVVLAVLARIVPEMDVLFMSFPLTVGLGLLMAGIFLPLVNGFLPEFSQWMGKLLPL